MNDRAASRCVNRLALSAGLALLAGRLCWCGIAPADEQGVRVAQPDLSVQPDPSLLNRVFIPDRRHSRLLLRARRSLDGDDATEALEVFRLLLDQPHDHIVGMRPDGTPVGVRESVHDLLVNTSIAIRREWSRAHDGIARQQLRRALDEGNITRLREVPIRYPFTSAGLDALLAESFMMHNQGRSGVAWRALEKAETWLPLGIASPQQRSAIRRLRELFRRTATPSSAESLAANGAPADPDIVPFTPELPSAAPIWTWQDSAWHHDQAAGIMPIDDFGSHLSLNVANLRPHLTKDRVILRTAAGIVCFGRDNGQVRWQIEAPAVESSGAADGYFGNPGAECSIMMFTQPVIRGSTMWFLDHVISGSNDFQRQFPRRQMSSDRRGARTLSCLNVERGPPVQWSTGDTPISGHVVSVDRHEESRLQDHLFISPPRLHRTSLYIVTEHRESTWLNCFAAATGRLLWQQPLGVLNAARQSVDAWVDAEEAAAIEAAVEIVDDVVVCVQSDGLVTGCRVHDGSIQWAKSIELPEEARDWPSSGNYLSVREASSQEQALWIHADRGRVFCGRGNCRQIFCFNAADGDITWTIVRAVDGRLEWSRRDVAIIGTTNNELILAGPSHCRAIRKDDGAQVWVADTGTVVGTPVCLSDQGLIPVSGQRLLAVDLRSGGISGVGRRAPTLEQTALAADEHGLVAAAAWRVSAWSWPEDSLRTTTLNSEEIDTRLDSLARHQLREIRELSDMPLWSAQHSRQDCVRDLQTATLTAEQSVRFAVLAPDVSSHASLLRDQLRRDAHQMVELLPGWQMRLVRALQTTHRTAPVRDLVDDALRNGILRSNLMDDLVVQPALIGNHRQQLDVADELIRAGRRVEAELLVLNMQQSTSHALPDLRARLMTIREPVLRADALAAPDAHPAGVIIQEEQLPPAYSRLVDEVLSGVESGPLEIPLPEWHRHRYVEHTSGQAGRTQRVLLDIGRDAMRNVHEILDENTRFYSSAFPEGHPSLLLGLGSDDNRVSVVSFLNGFRPEPLWRQPFMVDEFKSFPMLTSAFVILDTGDTVRALHPLTGEPLWIIDYSRSEELHTLSASRAQNRLGTTHLVHGLKADRWFLTRSTDGAVIRREEHHWGDNDAITSHYLYGLTEGEDKLRIRDLLTGNDVTPQSLRDTPIRTVETSDALPPGRLLIITDASEKSELLILDCDTQQIDVRISLAHRDAPLNESWDLTNVFRRNGRLFVSLADYPSDPDVGHYLTATEYSEQLSDQQLGGHGLMCLDENTFALQWRKRLPAANLVSMYGEPCPLMVVWRIVEIEDAVGVRVEYQSTHDIDGVGNLLSLLDVQAPTQELQITVLDAGTGRVVAEREHLLPAIPVRCVHDADRQAIELTTDRSVIRIQYTR